MATEVKVENKDEENLWQKLLKKAATKTQYPQCSLVLLGDKKNGSGQVLKKLRDRVAATNSTNNNTADKNREHVVDYSYINVKNYHDEEDADEIRAHLNIWEIDNTKYAESLLPRFLLSNKLNHTVYMITLDLSEPWSIKDTLDKWLQVLVKAHNQVFEQLQTKDQDAMRLSISKYVQSFVDKSQEQSGSTAELKVDQSIPKLNLGVPLIIVGCKGDKLEEVFKLQTEHGDRFEFLTRYLRLLSLDYGASLLFTSSLERQSEKQNSVATATNINVLQEYIYHRLYDFPLIHSAKVMGNENDFGIFVPSGFDSEDLINSIQPTKTWPTTTAFQQVFKQPEQSTKKNKAPVASRTDGEVKAEDNDLFFKKLKYDMEHNNRADASLSTPDRSKSTSRANANDLTRSSAVIKSSSKPAPSPTSAVNPNAAVPTGLPSPSPTAASTALNSASPSTNAAAAAASGDKKNHHAVKDFFRQLLNANEKSKTSVNRSDVRQAMVNIKSKNDNDASS